MAHPQLPGSLPAPQLFTSKKIEINELRPQLRQVTNDSESKRRELIKRVIACMTLGVDVSRLFTEMGMLSRTNDIAQKKMIYLYLVNYAESNSDLAIRAINTFLTDCLPSNPHNRIRGLALLIPAITNSLDDPDPYVRRTAIEGIAKLYRVNRALVLDTPFIKPSTSSYPWH
jgi:vesicle coat complex subunit